MRLPGIPVLLLLSITAFAQSAVPTMLSDQTVPHVAVASMKDGPLVVWTAGKVYANGHEVGTFAFGAARVASSGDFALVVWPTAVVVGGVNTSAI